MNESESQLPLQCLCQSLHLRQPFLAWACSNEAGAVRGRGVVSGREAGGNAPFYNMANVRHVVSWAGGMRTGRLDCEVAEVRWGARRC